MRHYPASYLHNIPESLSIANPLPSKEELQYAERIRSLFLFEGVPTPYVVDIVRGFRLLKERKIFIEIGSHDKGNLAYASTLLAHDALLIDIDIEPQPERSERLARFVKPGQEVQTIIGDSTDPKTFERVAKALDGAKADCVFVDGNRCASYCWTDFCFYSELVAPGGLVIFRDVFWQGNEEIFGVARAVEWLDRQQPVWVIFGQHSIHRFFPWMDKREEVWGGIGILEI